MEEHLVGYLLGALDPVTHARVEAHLKATPQARERLRRLEQTLAPLADDAAPPEPPPGLVLATLARIAEHRCVLPKAPVATPHQVGTPPRRVFRRIDWIVAACLLVFVGGIAIPVVAKQWQVYQRAACANNLRQFWGGLAAYSDRTEGEFPRVEREGPSGIAGIFVPILRDNGMAQDVSIGCPARGWQKPLPYSVEKLTELHARSPTEYRRVARELSGHYAYCLGYVEDGQHKGLRRDAGDGLPILADRSEDSTHNSTNHKSDGQNVLYVGGNVRWATQPTVGLERDHIFLNHHNRVQAGVCRIDSVLGTSAARPEGGE